MKKTIMNRKPQVIRANWFRSPIPAERALGLWVDRIGYYKNERPEEWPLRFLGLHAATAIMQGRGHLETLAGENTVTVAVAAGDVIMLSPKLPHRYYADPSWIQYCLVWGGPEADQLRQLAGGDNAPLVIHGGAPLVATACKNLQKWMAREDLPAVLARQGELLRMLSELWTIGRAETPQHPAVTAALAAFEQPDLLRLDIHHLAQQHGVSPVHFRRLFAATTGLAPKAYQQSRRINLAKMRLSRGGAIKTIAGELGFADVGHFMRTFRQLAGVTAAQFRHALSLGQAGAAAQNRRQQEAQKR